MNLGRKKILLNELLVEGAWVDEPKKVKEETKKNFDESTKVGLCLKLCLLVS